MSSLRSAAADRVAMPMSYVPPSPAQQTVGAVSSFIARTRATPVATDGELAKVVATAGTPKAVVGK